jgi:hypothetical protein
MWGAHATWETTWLAFTADSDGHVLDVNPQPWTDSQPYSPGVVVPLPVATETPGGFRLAVSVRRCVTRWGRESSWSSEYIDAWYWTCYLAVQGLVRFKEAAQFIDTAEARSTTAQTEDALRRVWLVVATQAMHRRAVSQRLLDATPRLSVPDVQSILVVDPTFAHDLETAANLAAALTEALALQAPAA